MYRADQFLRYPPLLQILALGLFTALLVAVFGCVAYVAFPPREGTLAQGLWWSLTLILDGGTMASAEPGQRSFALGVTVTGVFALSLATGAFASKMSARITELGDGKSPAVERGHIVILGFDSRVTFLARELARSGQPLVIVVMALTDKATIERALRPARRIDHSRVRFVVRTGDPRSEVALLRICADRARAVIVVPPAELDDAATVTWALATLLTLRLVLTPKFSGAVVIEARRKVTEQVLRLASEEDVAGPGEFRFQVVASDDVVARVLAQSARRDGVYDALREILTLEGTEIRAERPPRQLIGRSLSEAHARIEGAVLVGVLQQSGEHVFVPEAGEHTLEASDQMLLVADRSAQFHVGSGFERCTASGPVRSAVAGERVLLIGDSRSMGLVIGELDHVLPRHSTVVVMGGADAEGLLACKQSSLHHITLAYDGRRPLDLIANVDEALLAVDAVIILGCEDERDDNGDANALSTLLWLRHSLRRTGKRVRRVVTEVRDIESARSVSSKPSDFLVSSDVVGMLLARAALEPRTSAVYREILDSTGYELCLRPREHYLGAGAATFDQAMQAAHRCGEIAVGVYAPSLLNLRTVQGGHAGVFLNPPRGSMVPDEADAAVIVLAKPSDEFLAPVSLQSPA